jgi:hypothetical protein
MSSERLPTDAAGERLRAVPVADPKRTQERVAEFVGGLALLARATVAVEVGRDP